MTSGKKGDPWRAAMVLDLLDAAQLPRDRDTALVRDFVANSSGRSHIGLVAQGGWFPFVPWQPLPERTGVCCVTKFLYPKVKKLTKTVQGIDLICHYYFETEAVFSDVGRCDCKCCEFRQEIEETLSCYGFIPHRVVVEERREDCIVTEPEGHERQWRGEKLKKGEKKDCYGHKPSPGGQPDKDKGNWDLYMKGDCVYTARDWPIIAQPGKGCQLAVKFIGTIHDVCQGGTKDSKEFTLSCP
jgi:hypothetical protein